MTQVQKSNRSQSVGIGLVSVFVLATLSLLTYELWPQSTQSAASFGSFYSDDDGKTFYKDSVYKFPPFDHEGKTSYRAFVFKSDNGNFVGYLQRYNLATQKLLNDIYAKYQQGTKHLADVEMLMMSDQVKYGTEAKLPGPGHQWVPAQQISPFNIKLPNGTPASMVMP